MYKFIKNCIIFSLGIFVLFLSISCFNIYFDFYGVLRGDLSNQKTGPSERYLKIKHLINHPKKYNSYIMGSSRVSKIFVNNIEDNNSWYNLAYPEGVPAEHLSDIKLLLNNDVSICNLYIGIDNISFLVSPNSHNDKLIFQPYDSRPAVLLKFLMAKPSFRKILDLRHGKKINYDFYNTGDQKIIDKDRWIEENIDLHIKDNKFNLPTWTGYYYYRIDQTIKELLEIKEICKNQEINLTFFINPMHASTYSKLDVDKYMIFLQRLSEIHGFYDFSGFNSITKNNYNYYETSHFRPHVGELIKIKLFNQKSLTADSASFGNFISKSNIDSIVGFKKLEFCNHK